MLVRPPMINVKKTVRDDCAVSTCSPLPLTYVYESSCPTDCQWGQSAFGQMSALTPRPQLLAPKIKLTFLSVCLACFLALGQQAAVPHTHL